MKLTQKALREIVKREILKIPSLREAIGDDNEDEAMLTFFASVKKLVGFHGAEGMHSLLDSALAGDRPWVSDDDEEDSDYWSELEKKAGRERDEELRKRRV
jgi:hypothetical protein